MIEYLAAAQETGEELQRRRLDTMLEKVEITFVPLLNPVGFYRNEADERLSDEAIESLR